MTKTEAAYLEIRARILSGELAPGGAIDQESLAADLGLSTTPVREALRKLESDGWVSLAAHREARIAPLSLVELEELYGVRLSLDPLAAELACRNIDDAGIAELQRLLAEHHQPSSDDLHHNRRLHRAIYVASGNATLTSILDQLWDRSDRYRLTLIQEDAVVSVTSQYEHADIVAAVAARDRRQVAKLMRQHLLASLEKLRPMMRDR
jgi:DNA-binding GntR family transcriptional regulator